MSRSSYETNPVGALQERFQSRGITPQYRVVQAEGASHAPTFSFQVILGDLTATGSGSSKKQAKREAAQKMIDKLKTMGPNGGAASVTDVTQPEVDEDLINKMSTVKVDTLNSAASQKVASFYRKL